MNNSSVISSDEYYGFDLLMKRIPEDVIMHHIIPYSYKTQKKELLQDIHDYTNSIQKLLYIYDNIYAYEYDLEKVQNYLLTNMLWYFKFTKFTGFYDIFRRCYSFRNYTNVEVNTYFQTGFTYLSFEKQIYLFWGLLTVEERDEFYKKCNHNIVF